MDVVDVYAWVKASSNILKEVFIDNIFSDSLGYNVKIRSSSGILYLRVRPGIEIHITTREPVVKDVDFFTRFARSRIRDGKILTVEQQGWERIIKIDIVKGGERYENYIELIPRGAWVIVQQDKVLYASKFQSFKDRVIKPGARYLLPPSRGIEPSNREELMKGLELGKDLVRAIVSSWGLPGYIAEEIIYRGGLYGLKNSDPRSISQRDKEALLDAFNEVLRESSEGRGYLYLESQNPVFASPYKSALLTEQYLYDMRVTSINEAYDAYFSVLERLVLYEDEARKREEELKKIRERIAKVEEEIKSFEEKLRETQAILLVLYAHYQDVESALECAKRTRDESGWQNIAKICRNIVETVPQAGIIRLSLGNQTIGLKIHEPLDKQIIRLEITKGELEKKLQNALKILQQLQTEERQMIDVVKTMVIAVSPPQKWFERYHYLYTRNGFLVVGGRDASQNESIVKKYLGDDDIFLHAEIHGGSAAVLLTNRRVPSQEDIYDASFIPACYSKGWKAGFSYIDVYWVKGSNVSKSPPSGQFLAKGAFIVEGERNYVKTPLRLAVGIEEVCDEFQGKIMRISVSPPDLAEDRFVVYSIIVPGDLSVNEVSNTLIDEFNDLLEKEGLRLKISPNLVAERIPGPSTIIAVKKGRGAKQCVEEP